MTVQTNIDYLTPASYRRAGWSRTGIRVSLIAATIGLIACSSAQPPLITIGEAKMAVEQAERDDAHLYGQKSLSDAKVKLAEAEKSLDKKEFTKARRHAEQAIVDATLARTQADLAQAVGTAVEADDALRDVQNQ